MTSGYEELVSQVRADPDVVGAVLGGGRGKGFVTPHSDHDFYIVVKDEAVTDARQRYRGSADIELDVATIDEFERWYGLDGPAWWNRYNFCHLTALVDRLDGRFQQLMDDMEWLPPPIAEEQARKALGGYLNSLVRAVKNARDGNEAAAHLDSAPCASVLLDYVFAREGRLRPYNKFLAWELDLHPLNTLPKFEPDGFVNRVRSIVTEVNPPLLQQTFLLIEPSIREAGHGDVVDGWNRGSQQLMRGD